MDGLPPSARLVGIGFYVALCIVLGTLGGKWLDGALNVDTVFTLLGLVLGLVAAIGGGLRQLFDVLKAIERQQNQRRRGSD